MVWQHHHRLGSLAHDMMHGMSEEGKEAYEELGPRILQNWHGLASLHMCESCRRPVNIEDDTSDAIKVSVMGI